MSTDQVTDTTVVAAEADDVNKDESAPSQDLPLHLEAALMATDRALIAGRLIEILSPIANQSGKLTPGRIQKAIDSLNETYEQSQRSFRIEQVAGGWQILTLPAYAEVAAALNKTRAATKLSPAQLETLAIIAYKQPVLKADVEAIRGAASGEIIRLLMERKLVKITGRSEELGRPMLYGTTKAFLEVFGLASLKDLPKVEELKGKV
ncbi:MAG: SMC-Scp complex subunit ScpB [Phycisphaeraceae bacterium]